MVDEDLHVCFLLHRPYPGGLTSPEEYARHLARAGVEVTVVAGAHGDGVGERDRTGDRSTPEGVTVHRVPSRSFDKASFEPARFALRALRVARRVDRERPIDVLHTLAFPDLGPVLVPPPWVDVGAPVLVDVRTGATRNRAFNLVSKAAIRLQARLADAVVAIDGHVAADVLGRRDVPIVPLGVDRERFAPAPARDPARAKAEVGLDPASTVLGYVGTLRSVRRLHRVVEAFGRVADRHPDAELVLVGEGDGRPRMEAVAEAHGVRSRVRFPGRVPYESVPEYLRAFDVGLAYVPDQPQHRYQPPLKTVESLACGVPVLATDTPGNRRFVTDGENGLLAPESPEGYAAGIERLLADPGARAAYAERAPGSVERFDYGRIVAEDLLPVYRSLAR